ncbi:MAG: tryptophan synthase subunit alpha [Lentisphaerae bacterium GWF2_57_35]|nr:MAG: tryptophan synthase subunit alpha [Lentisphaerae bacterium GWF2_57_35]
MDESGRIEKCFSALRLKDEKGFVAYITAGDPSLAATVEMVRRLEEAGADVVELGVPFSDPLADGRVNQDSAARALKNGVNLQGIFKTVEKIRRASDIPLVLFSYINPLMSPSFEKNMREAHAAGVDGVLILDLPVEENRKYVRNLYENRLNNVSLVTPTSPDERIRRIVKYSTGFVYCVSREGVTGMQKKLAPSATELVKRTRRLTPLPVVLGFGISTPEQASAAARAADAVVVGSAIVDRFSREPQNPMGRRRAAAWVKTLIKAVKSVE